MKYHNNQTLVNKLIFFVIWPFGAFLYSLRDIRSKSSVVIFFLWCIVFGIGFNPVNEAADSFYYAQSFYRIFDVDWKSYVYLISDYLVLADFKDIYTTTVFFLVRSFTNNVHWVFMIFAIVFGFFYTRTMKSVLGVANRNTKIKYLSFFLLFFLFCFSNPIFNINGVRFWTASWIGVWLIFKIFVEGNLKYLPFILVTPLIHEAFFIYVAIVLIIYFFNKGYRIWSYIFIFSYFVSAVSFLNILHENVEILPQFLQDKVWSYTQSDEALEKMLGGSEPLYAEILNSLPNIYLNLMILLLIINRKQYNSYSLKLVRVLMIWGSITNFISSIPSVWRFYALLYPLLVFLWFYNWESLKKYEWIIYLIPFVYSYKVLYWVRNILSVSVIDTYFTPLPFIIIKNLF